MVKRESYAQGTPSWVELMTTDVAAAKEFYGGLLGWDFRAEPLPDGGVYHVAHIEGDQVAGLGEQNPELVGMPPTWNVYLAVDDVDAAAAEVPDAGGQVVAGPFDVMDLGRTAFVTDPSGATVGLWQAGAHIGSERANEPGAFSWNELVSPGYEQALPFYETVLGLGSEAVPMGPEDTAYTCFTVAGQQIAGAMKPPQDGIPPHWNVYFAVADCDAAVASAERLGGTVLAPSFDVPTVGRLAVLADPQGGMFNVMSYRAR